MKNPPNAAQAVFQTIWEIPYLSPNIKCMVPAFFVDRFAEQVGGMSTYKQSSEELGDWSHFVLSGPEL
jgi:hypothetical protein